MRFCAPGIFAGRPHKAHAALEMLEGDLDAPTQSIEGADCRERIFVAIERGDDDDPFARDQRLGQQIAALVACVARELVDRPTALLLGLADRHWTQCDRLFRRTFDPNGSVDKPFAARLFEKRNEIEAVAITLEPARIVPSGPHNDVGAGGAHPPDPVGPQLRTVTHADFARNNIGPVDDLSFALVRHHASASRPASVIRTRVASTCFPPAKPRSGCRGHHIAFEGTFR